MVLLIESPHSSSLTFKKMNPAINIQGTSSHQQEDVKSLCKRAFPVIVAGECSKKARMQESVEDEGKDKEEGGTSFDSKGSDESCR